jgi:hypothetical protein
MSAVDVVRARQPRERPVPCFWCRRDTFDLEAICDACRAEGRT